MTGATATTSGSSQGEDAATTASASGQDAGPGTDFNAVRSGHIAITPIHVDLTRYQALEQVASWVGGLSTTLEPEA